MTHWYKDQDANLSSPRSELKILKERSAEARTLKNDVNAVVIVCEVLTLRLVPLLAASFLALYLEVQTFKTTRYNIDNRINFLKVHKREKFVVSDFEFFTIL